MKRQHEQEAKIFCDAIKTIAERAEALENLELYLSIHFAEWLKKWANTPEGIAQELKEFATIEF
jgi:hypothetical protein